MSLARSQLAVVVLVMVVFAALRLVDYHGRYLLEFGGGISYLVSTGHEADYSSAETGERVNNWDNSGYWRNFVQPTGETEFEKIRLELTTTDIHPPLYFWILALLLNNVSSEIGAFLLLNIAFSLVTILIFYKTANLILHDPKWAAITTALFAFNPIMISPFISVARQYELLQLWVVAGLYFSAKAIFHGGRKLDYGGVVIAYFLGLMTQVQYVLLIAALVAALFVSRGVALSRKLAFCVCSALSAVMFAALNSEFVEAFLRYRDILDEPGIDGAAARVKRVVAEFGKLLGIDVVAFTPAVYLAVPIILLPLAFFAIHYIVRSESGNPGAQARKLTVTASLLLVFAVTAQYLSFNSPVHAMGGRYFYLFWPLLAISSVILLRHYSTVARSHRLMVAIFCWLLIVSVAQHFEAVARYETERTIHEWLQNASRIVANNPGRGRTARVLPNFSPAAAVFISDRSIGPEAMDAAVSLLNEGDVVILSSGYGIGKELMEQQYRAIADHRQVEEVTYGGLLFLRMLGSTSQ